MDTMITRVTATGSPYLTPVGAPPIAWPEVTRRLIEDQNVLGQLPERDLLDLVRRSQVRTLRARERIYRQGDPGRTVVAVLDGYVKLSSTTAAGREVVLEIVRAGRSFGELTAFNSWPRDSDAVTLSRCRLLAIDGRQFTQVMERTPDGLRMMVGLMSDRLRVATQRVLDTMALPAPARLAKALLHLAELQSPTPRDGDRLTLQLSQAELGGMTGLTRESINKRLASLRDAGWIALSGGSVTLLDIAGLESLLHDDDKERPGSKRVCVHLGEHVPTPPRANGRLAIQPAANRVGDPTPANPRRPAA